MLTMTPKVLHVDEILEMFALPINRNKFKKKIKNY